MSRDRAGQSGKAGGFVGELITDELPNIPDRVDPVLLLGRVARSVSGCRRWRPRSSRARSSPVPP
jgi:hypothetical protein